MGQKTGDKAKYYRERRKRNLRRVRMRTLRKELEQQSEAAPQAAARVVVSAPT